MNEIERQAMTALLEGEHPALCILRDQAAIAEVSSQQLTGVGFFTEFSLPATIPRVPSNGRVVIGDVYAQVEKLEHGAGFLLFIEKGVLSMLECFCCAHEPWPDNPRLIRIYYMHPRQPGSGELIECATRDTAWALAMLAH